MYHRKLSNLRSIDCTWKEGEVCCPWGQLELYQNHLAWESRKHGRPSTKFQNYQHRLWTWLSLWRKLKLRIQIQFQLHVAWSPHDWKCQFDGGTCILDPLARLPCDTTAFAFEDIDTVLLPSSMVQCFETFQAKNCRDLVHLLLMQLVPLQYLVKKTVSWDILLHSDVHHNQGSHKHCIDDHIAPLVTLSLHSPKVSIAYWLSKWVLERQPMASISCGMMPP